MPANDGSSCSAFDHHRLLATRPLADVVLAARHALDAGAGPLLIFDDRSSRQIEVDFRGSAQDLLARLPHDHAPRASATRGPGRPKLGVVPREVTLLPRHWDWLGQQAGGTSTVLRRLVEQALRGNDAKERAPGGRSGRPFHAGNGWRPGPL